MSCVIVEFFQINNYMIILYFRFAKVTSQLTYYSFKVIQFLAYYKSKLQSFHIYRWANKMIEEMIGRKHEGGGYKLHVSRVKWRRQNKLEQIIREGRKEDKANARRQTDVCRSLALEAASFSIFVQLSVNVCSVNGSLAKSERPITF